MRNRIFFLLMIVFAGCGQQEAPDKGTAVNNTQGALTDAVGQADAITYPGNGNMPVNVNDGQKTDTAINCKQLLLSLVDKSSFNPGMKKLVDKVWVDTLVRGVATLHLTMHNTERNDDVTVGWLKLDLINQQLWDITIDPDKPVQLTYDSSLFSLLGKECYVGRAQ